MRVALFVFILLFVFFITGAWKIAAPWMIETATTLPYLLAPQSPPRSNPDKTHCPNTLSTPELIDCANSEENITEEQRILYLSYALGDYGKLPSEYISNAPWDGTLVARDLQEIVSSEKQFCAFSKHTQNELRRQLPQAVNCP